MNAHRTALYQVDPFLFRDGEGHGWGTLDGITGKLDHVASLGTTLVWLLPFYASGDRDGGYDVVDHCAVDARLGDLAAFDRLVAAASERGIGLVIDLVMQHTSDRHPWFEAARADPDSRHRDWYVWADDPPLPGPDDTGPMFPPVQAGTWTWDPVAGRFFRHRFYRHEPDLDAGHPEVRAQMLKVMDFWLERGVAGFRVDALPFMVHDACRVDPTDDGLWLVDRLRAKLDEHRDDGVLIGEADVAVSSYGDYLDHGQRLTHLLDFHLNNHFFLALATADAPDIGKVEREYPASAPGTRRIVWLRNHDELNLSQLSDTEQEKVFDAFAPDPDMRVYGRGIRRRLGPMLGDDRRTAMATALVYSLGQPPILRYGEEIGLGENLQLHERHAVRVPMAWDGSDSAGFSDRPGVAWRKPVLDGEYGARRINVAAQERAGSLLDRVRELQRVRASLPAFDAPADFIDVGDDAVLAVRFERDGEVLLTLCNLADQPRRVALPASLRELRTALAHDATHDGASAVALGPYGYAWLLATTGNAAPASTPA